MAKDTQYWYQRTIDHLVLTGKSNRTAETYAREIKILGKYIDVPLEEVDEEDLREFILYRRNECKLGGSSMRILYCGIKALYQDVIGNKWPLLEVLKSQRETKLPVVISREDVAKILTHAPGPQNMTYLRVIYSCGLRLSEALNLTIHDIDGKRGLLHVRGGKGAKDRMVPLPVKTYRYLQHYWSLHRNPLYIFPALDGEVDGVRAR
jgi:integrase/recombinase XerD